MWEHGVRTQYPSFKHYSSNLEGFDKLSPNEITGQTNSIEA
jgi:hypothetical protein